MILRHGAVQASEGQLLKGKTYDVLVMVDPKTKATGGEVSPRPNFAVCF